MTKETSVPDCFGHLETVFPMGEKGLRQTPDDCFFHCPVKTSCLRQALGTTEGTKVEEEIIDRSHQAGAMGFLERWSRKKQLHKKRSSK